MIQLIKIILDFFPIDSEILHLSSSSLKAFANKSPNIILSIQSIIKTADWAILIV